jgi:hypothetical protein
VAAGSLIEEARIQGLEDMLAGLNVEPSTQSDLQPQPLPSEETAPVQTQEPQSEEEALDALVAGVEQQCRTDGEDGFFFDPPLSRAERERLYSSSSEGRS